MVNCCSVVFCVHSTEDLALAVLGVIPPCNTVVVGEKGRNPVDVRTTTVTIRTTQNINGKESLIFLKMYDELCEKNGFFLMQSELLISSVSEFTYSSIDIIYLKGVLSKEREIIIKKLCGCVIITFLIFDIASTKIY